MEGIRKGIRTGKGKETYNLNLMDGKKEMEKERERERKPTTYA